MKQVRAGIINVLNTTGGNHILDDTTNEIWGITAEGSIKTDDPVTLVFGVDGYWEYGSIKSVSYEDANAEVQQIAILGSETTETITASTRYAIEIRNSAEKYEGASKGKDVYAYTSPAVLSGTAATDRANVYASLRNKINARNNFVTAYKMFAVDYTLGTSAGDAATNFTVGEQITQETSSVTANVARCVIDSGTMAGDDAAGTLYYYNVSDESSLLQTAKDWTGGTSAVVVTQTNATTVTDDGIVLVDDANYWISNVTRGGASEVFASDGFDNDEWLVTRTHEYSRGIGSYMANLVPVLSRGGEDVVNLYGDYMLALHDDIDTSLTYRTYSIVVRKPHKDVNGVTTYHDVTYVLFVSDLNTGSELTEFNDALDTVAAK